MPDVTRILNQIENGDEKAAEDLLPIVYDELRKLATAKLSREKPGQTLQATALVHEAYLRLVGGNAQDAEWRHRGHFFAAAAEAMHRILIEQARRKKRLRHGGERQRIDFETLEVGSPAVSDDLLALDEALERLAEETPIAAQVVKLRYFAGLTIPQTAEALKLSVRTANRHWAYSKAWLYEELREKDESGDEKT